MRMFALANADADLNADFSTQTFAHADAKYCKSMQISAQLCGFGCGFLHFTVLFCIVPYVLSLYPHIFAVFADFQADFSIKMQILPLNCGSKL